MPLPAESPCAALSQLAHVVRFGERWLCAHRCVCSAACRHGCSHIEAQGAPLERSPERRTGCGCGFFALFGRSPLRLLDRKQGVPPIVERTRGEDPLRSWGRVPPSFARRQSRAFLRSRKDQG